MSEKVTKKMKEWAKKNKQTEEQVKKEKIKKNKQKEKYYKQIDIKERANILFPKVCVWAGLLYFISFISFLFALDFESFFEPFFWIFCGLWLCVFVGIFIGWILIKTLRCIAKILAIIGL